MRLGCITAALITVSSSIGQATISPREGGQMPRAYLEMKGQDASAFSIRRGWKAKARLIREMRRRDRTMGAKGGGSDQVLSGTMAIPILLGRFSNTSAVPYDSSALQVELFDGPWPTGTMADYYAEVSYGNLSVTGTVYGWVSVSQADTYYEGTGCPGPSGSCNGLQPPFAHTGQFIHEILGAKDGMIDFSQYDNDGPDGTPNSGDDDGYVDLIAVVHPETGGECGNANIWSHSWALRGWPEGEFVTNDVAAGGGFIRVDDYTIQPALACDGVTTIQIGVFCHELGHVLDLPDLYDIDGGSEGIGHWGLMGSGNWNTPSSPAHMCAWSKARLGWISPVDVGWAGSVVSVPQAETSPSAFRLAFTDERWTRQSECAIAGNYSVRCGLDSSMAAARKWLAGAGYGNAWDETVEHDFTFDGTLPVTFSYDYRYETDSGYDSIYVTIAVGGSETVLATYSGACGGTGYCDGSEIIDLSTILGAYAPPISYKLRFRFVSDVGWSDEDGGSPTACGAFLLDNVSLIGGGENYFSDFESLMDGWYQDPSVNATSEYWLVENRQPAGFDSFLHGSGLLIWHVDEEVLDSNLGNSGGGDSSSDRAVRGLVLEEADGNWDLLNGVNRGDAGDPYPGIASNTTFDSTTTPSSYDNTGRSTGIAVDQISSSSAIMSAFMRAGDPPPVISALIPDSVDNDQTAVLFTIDGERIRHGAAFRLTRSGEIDIVPVSTVWLDEKRITGVANVYSKKGGYWHLEVTNPDGQADSLADALLLNPLVSTQLLTAEIEEVEDGIEIRFILSRLEPEEVVVVKRSDSPRGPWIEPVWTESESRGLEYRFLDGGIEAGKTYYYRIDVIEATGRARNLYTGLASRRSREIALYQNTPNPFYPETSISFYLPVKSSVRLDVFDVRGKLVRRLLSGNVNAGLKSVKWDGKDERGRQVSSGVYFYRLALPKRFIVRKMVITD